VFVAGKIARACAITVALVSLSGGLAVGQQALSKPPASPVNLDLEQGTVGGVPDGWISGKTNAAFGYRVELVEERPHAGSRCARITNTVPEPSNFGNMMQRFDATVFRGRRIRLSAAIRAEVADDRSAAQMWLRVDRSAGARGFFDNMGDRPVRSAGWARYTIEGEVAPDAEEIYFGVFLLGRGSIWADGFSIEMLGPAGEGDRPAAALEGRALENLIAFTRLLGYVRYFHPAPAVATTAWERFAILGVEAVEPARSPEALATALASLFAPIAPQVQVFVTGQDPPPASGLHRPEGPAPQLVAWQHFGVGTGSPQSIYSSTIAPLDAGQLDRPAPDEPFAADLGGGVSCRVPITLWAGRAAASPAPASVERWPGRPEGWTPSGDDRSTRLAVAALSWNVFQHFNPYIDQVDVDWDAALGAVLEGAASDPSELAFLDTLRLMVAELDDGHGRVNHHGEALAMTVPLVFDWVEEQVVITAADAEESAGLSPGAVVLSIDGVPAQQALEKAEARISGSPQYKRHRATEEFGRGPQGSSAVLRVRTVAGSEREVTVARSRSPWGDDAPRESRPGTVTELEPGILYVDLDRVTKEELDGVERRIAAARGVVFDMRGYPRHTFTAVIPHLIDEPVTSAQWHVPTPHLPDRREMTFSFSNWSLAPARPRIGGRVAFLADARAISAAETFLGIIEHYRLGEIVGSATAGTNGNINPFAIAGYNFLWTGMRVLKHDGSRHHGIGILPTIPVRRTIVGVAAGRDELLEAGIRAVRGKDSAGRKPIAPKAASLRGVSAAGAASVAKPRRSGSAPGRDLPVRELPER
jgi:C-terminal processing protease CtpA/Prc